MGLAKVRFVASNSRTPVRADLSHSQLEESNRTLTVDVANLASEKEELNNHLKELQQRESSRKKKKTTNKNALPSILQVNFDRCCAAELQDAKDEEQNMSTLIVGFEKQLQNERTLKIQVRRAGSRFHSGRYSRHRIVRGPSRRQSASSPR